MIEYKFKGEGYLRVMLDGKWVGSIAHVDTTDEHQGGWQYTPKGEKKGGDIFPTLALCKKSLEAPTTDLSAEKEFVEAAKALAPLFGIVKAVTGITAERIIEATGDPVKERAILTEISANARRDANPLSGMLQDFKRG